MGWPRPPKPAGELQAISYVPWCGKRTVVDSDMRVLVEAERPWLAHVWEPLTCKVPSPSLTLPFCCLVNTVIFYLRPYVTRGDGRGLAEWVRMETRLVVDRICTIEGVEYEVGCGTVLWHGKRWWMHHPLRRRKPRAVAA